MTVRIDSSNEFFQTRFDRLQLNEGSISETIFEECTFTNGSFESCAIVDCAFVSCTFADCNLSLADLTNSRFSDVVFERTKLTGVNWIKTASSAVGHTARFEECILDYGLFSGCKLRGWTFRRCSLVEADFSEADLNAAVFAGSDLDRARFHHTDLAGAHLEGAYNYSVNESGPRCIFLAPGSGIPPSSPRDPSGRESRVRPSGTGVASDGLPDPLDRRSCAGGRIDLRE